jgi:hypothetical protein
MVLGEAKGMAQRFSEEAVDFPSGCDASCGHHHPKVLATMLVESSQNLSNAEFRIDKHTCRGDDAREERSSMLLRS